jgi:hypothetical protein
MFNSSFLTELEQKTISIQQNYHTHTMNLRSKKNVSKKNRKEILVEQRGFFGRSGGDKGP